MASELANINYEVRRGDTTSFSHRLTVGNTFEDSVAVDLTGWELHGQVKYDQDDETTWVDLSTYLTIVDAVDGRWKISFTATEAATLLPIGSPDATTAQYDIQLRQIGNEDTTTQTIQSGNFSVLADVTRVVV